MSFGKTMYQMLIAGSQAYAKWDLEVSTSILKNHKKMLFLLALAAAEMASFRRLDRTAGRLLVPYLAWLVFAAYLNYAIVRLTA